MSIFYVLIACDGGFEKSIINQLKTIEFVKEVKGVMRIYDILVKLESENSDLKDVIPSKIRQTPNIRTTLTLTVIESQK